MAYIIHMHVIDENLTETDVKAYMSNLPWANEFLWDILPAREDYKARKEEIHQRITNSKHVWLAETNTLSPKYYNQDVDWENTLWEHLVGTGLLPFTHLATGRNSVKQVVSELDSYDKQELLDDIRYSFHDWDYEEGFRATKASNSFDEINTFVFLLPADSKIAFIPWNE